MTITFINSLPALKTKYNKQNNSTIISADSKRNDTVVPRSIYPNLILNRNQNYNMYFTKANCPIHVHKFTQNNLDYLPSIL